MSRFDGLVASLEGRLTDLNTTVEELVAFRDASDLGGYFSAYRDKVGRATELVVMVETALEELARAQGIEGAKKYLDEIRDPNWFLINDAVSDDTYLPWLIGMHPGLPAVFHPRYGGDGQPAIGTVLSADLMVADHPLLAPAAVTLPSMYVWDDWNFLSMDGEAWWHLYKGLPLFDSGRWEPTFGEVKKVARSPRLLEIGYPIQNTLVISHKYV